MKQNMKRMLLVLCMAVCFFALSACSSTSDEVVEPISAEIEQTMSDGVKSYLESFVGYSDDDLQEQLKQAQKQKNTVIESAISSWINSKNDLGAMNEILSVTVARADEDSYTAVLEASFEKRNLTFSLTAEESQSTYGGTSLVPTELTFVPNYSLGEKMEKAALNTLMGMGTVFLVLIFISLIISCFKKINQIEANMKAKNAAPEAAPAPAAPVAAPAPAPAAPVKKVREPLPRRSGNAAKNGELVAVITAAIATATGIPADRIIIRSITRK